MMLRIKDDWRTILKKAWSVRFIALAGLLSGLEVVLPFFSGVVKPGLFAVLSFLSVSAAFIARIVVQKDL